MNHDLIYTKHNNEIINYSNSDYINNMSICCFTAEYVFYFAEEFITARLTFMKMIILSMMKTEYMTLCSAV